MKNLMTAYNVIKLCVEEHHSFIHYYILINILIIKKIIQQIVKIT